MTKEYDFKGGKRGAVLLTSPGKTRITIRLDDDILEWFRNQADRSGRGNYQTLINKALRAFIDDHRESLVEELRTVVREEISDYRAGSESECWQESRWPALSPTESIDGEVKRLELESLRLRALALHDLEACHDLGAALATGFHGEATSLQDRRSAYCWYLRAAQGGHPESQYDLGFMILLGEGVVRDEAAGLRWVEASAKSGYSEAIRLLVDLFSRGEYGVEPDEAVARHWSQALSEHLRKRPEDRREHEKKPSS